MTLADLYLKWYLQLDVLDPKRIRTAWKQFAGLHKLTPEKLTSEAVCKERDRLLKTLSTSTVRRSLGVIAVFAQWLADEKHIKARPTWKTTPESRPRQRWLSTAEMKLMMTTARREDVPLYFDQAIHLSFLTGQRITAILELKWDQIAGQVIDFNQGIHERSKRRGIIPVTAAIKGILDECRGNQPFVLGRIRYDQFLKEWERVCELCGIEDATPHTMRHSVATNLVASGTPIIEVSRLLGHSNSAITERCYAKFAPDYTRAASEAMGRMLA